MVELMDSTPWLKEAVEGYLAAEPQLRNKDVTPEAAFLRVIALALLSLACDRLETPFDSDDTWVPEPPIDPRNGGSDGLHTRIHARPTWEKPSLG